MATYKTQAMVLKKTKLGEKDLILTLLSGEGMQIRCVAKGARKPGSTFSARLEQFCVVDALLYKGKNLDTITEVKILDSNEAARCDLEHLAYGAVIAEFVENVALEGEENHILFPLTYAALQSVGRVEVDALPFVVSGYLLKAISYLGYRPALEDCTICGALRKDFDDQIENLPIEDFDDEESRYLQTGAYSISAGGWVCPQCLAFGEIVSDDIVEEAIASWVRALIGLKFEQIEEMFATNIAGANALASEVLIFCDNWMKTHLDLRLKALSYLSRL